MRYGFDLALYVQSGNFNFGARYNDVSGQWQYNGHGWAGLPEIQTAVKILAKLPDPTKEGFRSALHTLCTPESISDVFPAVLVYDAIAKSHDGNDRQYLFDDAISKGYARYMRDNTKEVNCD